MFGAVDRHWWFVARRKINQKISTPGPMLGLNLFLRLAVEPVQLLAFNMLFKRKSSIAITIPTRMFNKALPKIFPGNVLVACILLTF
jgi:hypothetical protein